MKKGHLVLVLVLVVACISPWNNVCLGYDPGVPDSVVWGELVYYITGPPYEGSAVLPVRAVHDEYLLELDIPFEWAGPLVADSGRFASDVGPSISFGEIIVDPSWCEIFVTTLSGDSFLPPANDTLAYLYFTVQDTGVVFFDTIMGGGPGTRYVHFVDSTWEVILPGVERPWSYHIQSSLSGDANQDGVVDVGDAVFLLNYLFKNGLPPQPPGRGDANGDCTVDLGDAIHLLNYLYKGGPGPQSGCLW